MMGTEWFPKMLCFLSELTWLTAQEDFITSCRRESFKSHLMRVFLTSSKIYVNVFIHNFISSSSSLGVTALREPWPPVLFASTGLYPELSFSILQSPFLVSPLEHHLAI
jgi:hypothetical protein